MNRILEDLAKVDLRGDEPLPVLQQRLALLRALPDPDGNPVLYATMWVTEVQIAERLNPFLAAQRAREEAEASEQTEHS
jgi:hypothetical protein